MSTYIHNNSMSDYFERVRKHRLEQFTVMPEFGVTVYDAVNAPFDRDSNKPVYAYIPSRESQIQKRGAYQANQSLTTMYKRKAPSSAYNSARFDAEFGPSAPVALKKPRTELYMRAASQQAAWQQKNSLATQVRRLIQGKKKDAADVTRLSGAAATAIYGLTSSTATATAADTTGLIITDSDRATINSIAVRGQFDLRPIAATVANAIATQSSCRQRLIVAWLYKPTTDASAAGTLPPVTEVLVSSSVDSMYIQDAANANRFTILSDRTFDLGRALLLSDSSLGMDGASKRVTFNYNVKVNKQMFFKAPANPTYPGGHYDSDNNPGQVTKGVLVMYHISDKGAGVAGTDAGNCIGQIITRLNYTA